MVLFVQRRQTPKCTRTDTLLPYATLFRSAAQQHRGAVAVDDLGAACMEKALCLRRRAGQAQQQCGGDQTKRHHSGSPLLRGYSRSEEHTSELQSLMRISYAVFCLKKKNT